ncbi:hypothetical protein LTR85_004959 [Meristemomyces frigidus]|nr:hypothetical protein LTR85_004959 [Meristemomyces frigidus]
METVLVVGATGNIGVSAVQAALHSGLQVLAIVRNQASAEKLFLHLGTRDRIITVEADITSDSGVRSVVDRVKDGKLPPFQHVYSAAYLRQIMNVNFESNFCKSAIRSTLMHDDELMSGAVAYRDTVPYLLQQNHPKATWTLCTGASGDWGLRAAPGMTQGALFAMANVGCRDNADTNVRFNEVYLACRVEVDSSAKKTGAMKASDFAPVYEVILSKPEIKGCRISVHGPADLKDLKVKKKFEA